MRKLLPASALLALTLATSGCAESPAFRHATYLGYPYEYDEASGLAVLDHNKPKGNFDHEIAAQSPVMLSQEEQSSSRGALAPLRDDVRVPKRLSHDPSALFADPFRGRNWR